MEKPRACPFCSSDGPICASHILPNALYDSMRDDKNRLGQCAAEQWYPVQYEQSGVNEPLLCDECEKLFNTRWDDFGVDVFRRLLALIESKRDRQPIVVRDVDSTRFHMFQLSVLWRAGVAHHPLYRNVRLGPHEAKLRELLQQGRSDALVHYPCATVGIVPSAESYGMVGSPQAGRINGHRMIDFIVPRMRWLFVISSHFPVSEALHINPPGVLRVPIAQFSEDEFIFNALSEVDRIRKSQGRRTIQHGLGR